MVFNKLPWKFIIRAVAKTNGFLDPIALRVRLAGFSQPSEISEPIELLRAGALFHARGLINAKVIQHNLDWVWPYWVEKQYNPADVSYIPRAFSITHINLTHRNWTAIGLPDLDLLPIVDPRGLITPFLDKWSIDFWVTTRDKLFLNPSRSDTTKQHLEIEHSLAVITKTIYKEISLQSTAEVRETEKGSVCFVKVKASFDKEAFIVFALRPYNPEGVSFIHKIELTPDRMGWLIEEDSLPCVEFSEPVEFHHVSDYRRGDVYIHLHDLDDEVLVNCRVGMATAAALFRINPGVTRVITAQIPLPQKKSNKKSKPLKWNEALKGSCKIQIPDSHFRFLYDAAIKTLCLHSPCDVYPGPYTYKRFWFRDAAFIIHALLCAGFESRAERALDQFPRRQNMHGYFLSQDGEWDSNGEALWIILRFCELTGKLPKYTWREAIIHGAGWIEKKRIKNKSETRHNGLLPAGFSAEHLGPNDYYYWDDFWGIAGLKAACDLAMLYGDEKNSEKFSKNANNFLSAVNSSISRTMISINQQAIPASPYRRLDAGAIGSIVCDYPLQIYLPGDTRVINTVNFLVNNCFFSGGFFQDMIHSGINAYLTLHIAQVMLRADNSCFYELMKRVAAMASPTGQWPEAIHPRTGGGCMGDGQHVWAAAEWLLLMRNCFVREEGKYLILASGIPESWLNPGEELFFGPAPTPYGAVTIRIASYADKVVITWSADWRNTPPKIEVRLKGFSSVEVDSAIKSIELQRNLAK